MFSANDTQYAIYATTQRPDDPLRTAAKDVALFFIGRAVGRQLRKLVRPGK